MNTLIKTSTVFAASLFLNAACPINAGANGVQAELRSSAAILPVLPAGTALPTAPAGGLIIGAQPWVADAAQGFTQVLDVDAGPGDPLLALNKPGLHLPISPTTVPATCGQIAYDGNGHAYITQGVVDTTVTPSVARGILRVTLDPQ